MDAEEYLKFAKKSAQLEPAIQKIHRKEEQVNSAKRRLEEAQNDYDQAVLNYKYSLDAFKSYYADIDFPAISVEQVVNRVIESIKQNGRGMS